MSENDTFTPPLSPSLPDAPGQRQSSRWVRLVGYAVGVMLAFGLAILGFWITATMRGSTAVVATSAPLQEPTPIVPLALQRPIVTEEGLVEKSGVRLLYVAVTGGGGLIDLRFQVIDPDKAIAVHEADTPPTIVDATTGLVVHELLMGHMHTAPYTAGQTYYLIFENPGSILKSGGTVSILLGDAQVDNIIVK